ncbi:MAG: CARDB domain-containing protein [Patescibacteria group bacterium]|nr:CARDB domain-containing protein [Patescibacteria group bacterium]
MKKLIIFVFMILICGFITTNCVFASEPYQVTNLANNANPYSLTNVNGMLYFTATTDENIQYISNSKLWKSDGTETGTVVIKNINQTINGTSFTTSPYFTNVNNKLYFVANDGINGYELWKSDGTTNGTVMVKDISTGISSSNPQDLININEVLYFRANNSDGSRLWKSDGTEIGTEVVNNTASAPRYLTNVNGTLYFVANDEINGYELWKSDGTENGTVMVKDIEAGINSSNPQDLINVNGILYFQIMKNLTSIELWKSDGTSDGTQKIRDIDIIGSQDQKYLTNVNGVLYFVIYKGIGNYELWKSDGTVNGTIIVKSFTNSVYYGPSRLTNFNGILYFIYNDRINGSELWKSNGTTNGTVIVTNVNGNNSYQLNNLINANGVLYFTNKESELWKSDGTENGTIKISNSNIQSISKLTSASEKLFFIADSITSGMELFAYVPGSNTPVTCTSWTYSNWSTCNNGTQIRTVITQSPSGCTGGNPVLTQSCNSTPTTCTSWNYSAWGSCTNNQQTRAVTSSSPSNCIGGSPVLTQSCSNGVDLIVSNITINSDSTGNHIRVTVKNIGNQNLVMNQSVILKLTFGTNISEIQSCNTTGWAPCSIGNKYNGSIAINAYGKSTLAAGEEYSITFDNTTYLLEKVEFNNNTDYLIRAMVDWTDMIEESNENNNTLTKSHNIAPSTSWTTGQWIKTDDSSTVYFLDNNNARHSYPNEAIWYSYFNNDFSFVKTVTKDNLASYSLGKNVPYKSGTLIKIPSVPKVYKIGNDGIIQWIKTENTAKTLYGDNWNKLVHDLDESSFNDYTEGDSIE